MSLELVALERAKWSNEESRRRFAVLALEEHDVGALHGLMREYLHRKSRKKTSLSPLTLKAYKRGVAHLLEYCWEIVNVHILQVSPDMIDAFLGFLNDRPGRREGSTLKRASLEAYLAGIRVFFRALVWAGARRDNPCDGAFAPAKSANSERPVLRRDEVNAMLASLETREDARLEIRDRALLELGLNTFLRASEIVGLKLTDIDLGLGAVTVNGKGGKRQTVRLLKAPLEALKAWLALRPSLVSLASGDAVFLSLSKRCTGNPIGYRAAYDAFKLAVGTLETQRGVGASLGGMHTLRRTGATRHHAANKDLLALQRLLGHSSTTTTAVYAVLDDAAVWQSQLEMEKVERQARAAPGE